MGRRIRSGAFERNGIYNSAAADAWSEDQEERSPTVWGQFTKWGTGNDARWWQYLVWCSVILGLVLVIDNW